MSFPQSFLSFSFFFVVLPIIIFAAAGACFVDSFVTPLTSECETQDCALLLLLAAVLLLFTLARLCVLLQALGGGVVGGCNEWVEICFGVGAGKCCGQYLVPTSRWNGCV